MKAGRNNKIAGLEEDIALMLSLGDDFDCQQHEYPGRSETKEFAQKWDSLCAFFVEKQPNYIRQDIKGQH